MSSKGRTVTKKELDTRRLATRKLTTGGNCNSCNVGDRCSGCADMSTMVTCPAHRPPEGKFTLIELALFHPTSLNNCLSELTRLRHLKIRLEDYNVGSKK